MALDTALSPIEALPAELIHRIFFYMSPSDVLSSRSVCSLFAEIGIDHHFENIIICFKRQHFQRFWTLRTTTGLQSEFAPLHYHARRFQDFHNYTSWLHLPRCPVSATSQDWPKYLDSPQPELEAAYQKYVEMHEDQEVVLTQAFDVQCFATLCQCCPDLDTVTIDMSRHHSRTERTSPHTAFAQALTDPICDGQWRMRRPENNAFGVQPLYAISTAFEGRARPLRRLELVAVSNEAMMMEPRLLPSLGPLMHGLRELHVSCYNMDKWTAPERDIDLELGKKFCGEGPKRLCLSVHASNLEILQVHCIDINGVCLLFRQHTWPKLRRLSLPNVYANHYQLESLFLRHSESLEELSGAGIYCGDDDNSNKLWHQAFRRVEHRLTKLRKVELN